MTGWATRPLMHPLCGANLATLVTVLAANGGVAPRALPRAGLALAVSALRVPFTALERAWLGRRLARAGEMPAPVFIIGHWRSGTTHLFNILARHGFAYVGPIAAGMPWDFMGLAAPLRSALERLMPKTRYVDDIPVEPDSPQEDEVPLANMSALSFYHGIYFPRALRRNFDRGVFFDGCAPAQVRAREKAFEYFSRKVWLAGGQRRLLVKNPVYTARIAAVREIWPDARFIHCIRDPYAVFPSMRNFYERLFAAFALQPYDDVAVDELVIAGYARMMDRLIAESAEVPEGRFVEVRYERLASDPLAEVGRVYRGLGLPGFADAERAFRAYLERVRGYQGSAHRLSADDVARIEASWGRFIDRWGYARPGA